MEDLKKIRKVLGLSQTAAAEYIGMPMRTLQEWEGGRQSPPDYVMNLVIEKLKTYPKKK